ncbi:MAG TPA: hypothetical protein VLE99_02535 [Candidatus Saccharimonadales bacterium]|nr:hypothetical protein [Candidatus Saccharimonadales bacterium]
MAIATGEQMNDLGAATMPPPERYSYYHVPRPDEVADNQLLRLLTEELGHKRHHRFDVKPPRAEIVDSGIAGESAPTYSLGYIDDSSGTLVMSETSGPTELADAAAFGFQLTMDRDSVGIGGVRSPRRAVEQALSGNVPRAIRVAAGRLEASSEPPVVTTTGLQIVDNTLVHASNGNHGVFVYGPNGSCDRLRASANGAASTYHLGVGQNIVVMCSSQAPNSDRRLTRDVGTTIAAAIQSYRKMIDPPTSLSQYIADRLDTAPGRAGSTGTILVTAVDVAPAKARVPSQSRRQAATRLAGTAATTGYQSPQQIAVMPELPRPGRRATIAAVVAATALAAVVWGGVRVVSSSHTPQATGKPHDSTPISGVFIGQPKPIPFPAVYTAHHNDTANSNKASNITNIAQQALRYYGEQAHLPPAQIDQLANNPDTLHHLIVTFLADTTDPSNVTAHSDPRHWLYNGATYSTTGLASEAQALVAARAQALNASTAGQNTQPSTLPAATAPGINLAAGQATPISSRGGVAPQHPLPTGKASAAANPRPQPANASLLAAQEGLNWWIVDTAGALILAALGGVARARRRTNLAPAGHESREQREMREWVLSDQYATTHGKTRTLRALLKTVPDLLNERTLPATLAVKYGRTPLNEPSAARATQSSGANSSNARRWRLGRGNQSSTRNSRRTTARAESMTSVSLNGQPTAMSGTLY